MWSAIAFVAGVAPDNRKQMIPVTEILAQQMSDEGDQTLMNFSTNWHHFQLSRDTIQLKRANQRALRNLLIL